MNSMDATAKPPLSPSLPWKTKIALSVLSAVTDASRRSNGTVNRFLLKVLDIKSGANSNPIKGVKTSDVTVDSSRNLWFRLFVPTGDDSRDPSRGIPVIVFFHGGGFAYLSPDNRAYDAVCRRFARKVPAIVISVNYRLSPEHKYPSQYDDGLDVLKFLDDVKNRQIFPENADLSCCFLAGDSAGGNIAHHVADRACQFKFQKVKVTGLVAIQPFFGGEERTEAEIKLVNAHLVSVARTDWLWKAFLPEGERQWGRDHKAINVSGPRAIDMSQLDFPATLVFVGGFDALQDWQRRYYHWLKRSGKEVYLIEYPNMIHAFYVFPELPESRQLISEVRDFVHKHCSSASDSSSMGVNA